MMRTSVLRFFLVALVIVAWALSAMAYERVYHAWRHTEFSALSSVTEETKTPSIRPTPIGEWMETQLLDTGILRVTNIHFVTAKKELTPESREVLDQIGRILMDWPTLKVEIAGHADSRGSEEFNQTLSESRAWAVRKYLVRRFPKIRDWLLVPVGYGESRPLAANSTTEGMAKNRRVEFVVLNEAELVRVAQMRAHRAGYQ